MNAPAAKGLICVPRYPSLTVVQRIENVLEDVTGFPAPVDRAMLLTDLGVDSLELIEFFIALEGELGVPIDDEDAENLDTLQQVIDFIEARV